MENRPIEDPAAEVLPDLANLSIQEEPIPVVNQQLLDYSLMAAEIKLSSAEVWRSLHQSQPAAAKDDSAAATDGRITTVASVAATDGRITSAIKEQPFLLALIDDLKRRHPDWKFELGKDRYWYDISINDVPINLKLSDCKSADNAANKRAFFYSICGGLHDYPASSNWNKFWAKLSEAKAQNKMKLDRNPRTEYHYLVVNKKTGAVLFKPIFDIKNYYPNPSNEFQIKWGEEFAYQDYRCPPTREEYQKKIAQLLGTIQHSINEMICSVQQMATANLDGFFAAPPASGQQTTD